MLTNRDVLNRFKSSVNDKNLQFSSDIVKEDY